MYPLDELDGKVKGFYKKMQFFNIGVIADNGSNHPIYEGTDLYIKDRKILSIKTKNARKQEFSSQIFLQARVKIMRIVINVESQIYVYNSCLKP